MDGGVGGEAALLSAAEIRLLSLGGLSVILVRVCCGLPFFFHDIRDWIFLLCHFLPDFFVFDPEAASSPESSPL